VFVPNELIQPRLVRAYPMKHLSGRFLDLIANRRLVWRRQPWTNTLALVNYDRKKFYKIGPRFNFGFHLFIGSCEAVHLDPAILVTMLKNLFFLRH
jgi:hypothetical protein